MSRHSKSVSTNHAIQRHCHDCYGLRWTVDRYYSGSRLRFPTRYSRVTNYKGAVRFAKKWGLEPPKYVTGETI